MGGVLAGVVAHAASVASREAADSCQAKLNTILSGSLSESPGPVRFTEDEANSYLTLEASRGYPAGLSGIEMQFLSGRLAGTAQVDFDQLKKSSRSPLPPMMEYLLFGEHELKVEGTLEGTNGRGQFKLEAVEIDGVPMPQMLVDVLIDYYLKRSHPNLDLGAPFRLLFSIERLDVRPGVVEVAGAATLRL